MKSGASRVFLRFNLPRKSSWEGHGNIAKNYFSQAWRGEAQLASHDSRKPAGERGIYGLSGGRAIGASAGLARAALPGGQP
jgi:hypothetical protein